jgi:hypothetical protein
MDAHARVRLRCRAVVVHGEPALPPHLTSYVPDDRELPGGCPAEGSR